MSAIKPQEDLILGAYKEPLRKVANGFGYLGAISLTKEGKIQCHVCGKCFDNLSFHARRHKLTAAEYRKKFQLGASTRLISETCREQMKMRMFAVNSKRKKGWAKAMSKKGIKARKNSGGITLEHKNLRGICPDQLLQIIRDTAEYYKETPSYEKFIEYVGSNRFMEPIRRTFGTWSKAVMQAGLIKRKRTLTQGHKRYSDEELLEYLFDFHKQNNTIPSRSDYTRGLLPHYVTYIRRFGSLQEARRKAHIPNWESSHWHKTRQASPIFRLQQQVTS